MWPPRIHREALGTAEEAGPGHRGHRLLAGVDQVGVDLVVGRVGPDAQQAVLALQLHVDVGRDVVRAQRRNPDAEVDVVAVLDPAGGAGRHLLAVQCHRQLSETEQRSNPASGASTRRRPGLRIRIRQPLDWPADQGPRRRRGDCHRHPPRTGSGTGVLGPRALISPLAPAALGAMRGFATGCRPTAAGPLRGWIGDWVGSVFAFASPWRKSPLHSSGDASRPTALFVGYICPICALLTPCQARAFLARERSQPPAALGAMRVFTTGGYAGSPANRRSTIGRNNRCARCRRTATFLAGKMQSPRDPRRPNDARCRGAARCRGTSAAARRSLPAARASTRGRTPPHRETGYRRAVPPRVPVEPVRLGRRPVADSGARPSSGASPSWRTIAATQEHAGGPPWYCRSFCSTMIQLSCSASRAVASSPAMRLAKGRKRAVQHRIQRSVSCSSSGHWTDSSSGGFKGADSTCRATDLEQPHWIVSRRAYLPAGPSQAPPPPCAGRIVAGPAAPDGRNRGSHAAPAGRQDGGDPLNRGRPSRAVSVGCP